MCPTNTALPTLRLGKLTLRGTLKRLVSKDTFEFIEVTRRVSVRNTAIAALAPLVTLQIAGNAIAVRQKND